jgi:hypothetical protein
MKGLSALGEAFLVSSFLDSSHITFIAKCNGVRIAPDAA